MKAHIKNAHEHDGKRPRPFLCQICGKSFKTAAGVKSHTDLVHMEESSEKFRCDICDRNYKTEAILRFHMKLSHESTPVDCSICGKSIRNKVALTR